MASNVEPTYEFVRGTGWVVYSETVLLFAQDSAHKPVCVVRREPRQGEYYFRIYKKGAWYEADGKLNMKEVKEYIEGAVMTDFAYHDGDNYQRQPNRDYFVVEYL